MPVLTVALRAWTNTITWGDTRETRPTEAVEWRQNEWRVVVGVWVREFGDTKIALRYKNNNGLKHLSRHFRVLRASRSPPPAAGRRPAARRLSFLDVMN
ncbi:hypothetical protein EYF80_018720 [Liparis tanakae]|uniref:Uncharacterized protein n=1 Tax=Liparis tanakae TaxID=230148 RepID=A0A4Z2HYX0_9TELE|nr:hypothetical protein EYF80_018720 [Liparis tanakae]